MGDPSSRRRHARHEAAHALVAWLCGHPCRLSIDPADVHVRGAQGLCEVLNPDCSVSDQLLVALAGPAADGELTEACHDVVRAVALAARLNPADPAGELNCYYVAAVNVLRLGRLARAHAQLADELARRGRLGPADVDAAIAAGMGRRSARYSPCRHQNSKRGGR